MDFDKTKRWHSGAEGGYRQMGWDEVERFCAHCCSGDVEGTEYSLLRCGSVVRKRCWRSDWKS